VGITHPLDSMQTLGHFLSTLRNFIPNDRIRAAVTWRHGKSEQQRRRDATGQRHEGLEQRRHGGKPGRSRGEEKADRVRAVAMWRRGDAEVHRVGVVAM
jgi:hypothetical protein